MAKQEKQTTCSICGKKLRFWTTSLKKYKDKKVCTGCFRKITLGEMKNDLQEAKKNTESTLKNNEPKKVSEIRTTCLACGNTWHYGKSEQFENCGNSMQQVGKAMMCCGGCVPALVIPDKEVKDLNKCPKCGSKATKKETITYDIK
jgi:hypothetical protein